MSAEPTTPEGTPRAESPKLEGRTEPTAKAAPATKTRRTHAEAADRTIEILRETLAKEQQEYQDAVRRLETELTAERTKRDEAVAEERRKAEVAVTAERTKGEEAVAAERGKREALAGEARNCEVQAARLDTENRALRREAVRSKLIDVFAGALVAVGGGMVSYCTDQWYKDLGLYILISGVALLFLNVFSVFVSRKTEG